MLTVLRREGTLNTFAAWRVRCACGIEKIVRGHCLRRGQTMSCGCDKGARISEARTTHGLSHQPTWSSWMAMRHRCSNPNDPSYPRYGGRGIRVSPTWADSFESFLADMGVRPSLEFTIDRKDVNGDYVPGNCRWASGKEQGRNRRNNRLLSYAGESMPLSAWAERRGMGRATLRARLENGWSLHDALHVPLGARTRWG